MSNQSKVSASRDGIHGKLALPQPAGLIAPLFIKTASRITETIYARSSAKLVDAFGTSGVHDCQFKALPATSQATSPAFAARCIICNKDPEQTRTSAGSNRSSSLDVSRHQMPLTGRKLRPALWRTPGKRKNPCSCKIPVITKLSDTLQPPQGTSSRYAPVRRTLVSSLCASHASPDDTDLSCPCPSSL